MSKNCNPVMGAQNLIKNIKNFQETTHIHSSFFLFQGLASAGL
jgi:hypothetical protein